ncbi:MAG: membrane protein insertase YidC, partial [Lentisphaeraceae bacterium]|nr:membrane protein insertase YidC [Lentisphaeraceae bacterium]
GWVCKLLLPILNGFYWLIPNYGVAIILLTLLVRLVFWPLTHKSTVAMRKMSIIQPQIKALQQQFKDQPQKIQQETFKLYREHKVNPFSSCLPMLVQIPIFIALFVVLRSAIELRFASFLWIADLSQPENLFAGFLPVPLNILPILTAVTMGLQTALSPSTGDPAQKKMMTWMMPIMMLFMFYQMASALCLYWTVSQVLSIVQMWLIQRSAKAEAVRA